MTAAAYDFTIRQGATFQRVLTYKDAAGALVNLTGYTGRMQVRRGNTLLATASVSLGGSAGTITVTIPKETTAALPVVEADYDLFLTSAGGLADCLLAGTLTVEGAVSR